MTALTLSANLSARGLNGAGLRGLDYFLNFCDEHKCVATLFVSGKAALQAPQAIKEAARRGHEIAYYGHADLPLTEEHPEVFQREVYVDKARLEELSGQSILGYRPPAFSMNASTIWAIDKLGKLGFRYTSSVVPCRLGRVTLPSAPHHPFLWPNGMIEIPQTVAPFGPVSVPFLKAPWIGMISREGLRKACLDVAARSRKTPLVLSVDTECLAADQGFRSALDRAICDKARQLITSFETTLPLGALASDKSFRKGLVKF